MKTWKVLGFAAVFTAVNVLADLYSWTDKNGVKHFSNDPPPKDEPITDLVVLKASRVVEETAEPEAPKASESKPDTSASKATKKVVLYVDPRSEYCDQAMAFFDGNGIPYTKYDVTTEDGNRRFESLNCKGVPLIFIGEERMD